MCRLFPARGRKQISAYVVEHLNLYSCHSSVHRASSSACLCSGFSTLTYVTVGDFSSESPVLNHLSQRDHRVLRPIVFFQQHLGFSHCLPTTAQQPNTHLHTNTDKHVPHMYHKYSVTVLELLRSTVSVLCTTGYCRWMVDGYSLFTFLHF